MIRVFFNYLFTLLFVIGLCGLFYNALLGSKGNNPNRELPLYDIGDVVEKDSLVYVVLPYYHRLQIYDQTGKFLNFRPTETLSKRIEASKWDGATPSIIAFHDLAGNPKNTFRISSLLPITLSKIDSQGNKTPIIKQPWHMSLWFGPLGSWLIAACATFIIFATNIVSFSNAMSMSGTFLQKWIWVIFRLYFNSSSD